MTTLNARANQAWRASMQQPHPRDAFEEGWETGYKTAESEAAARANSFRGVHEKAAVAEAAEEIATVAEEFADDLEPPTTVEWLELRDWFKDQLHKVAARAREIGGVS